MPASRRAAVCSRNSAGCNMGRERRRPGPDGSLRRDSEDLKNAIQFVITEEANVERAYSLAIAQLHLGAQALAEFGLQDGDVHVRNDRPPRPRRARAGSKERLLLQVRDQRLGLTHIQSLAQNTVGRQLLFRPAAQTEDDLAMSHGKAALPNERLNFRRER